VDEIAILKELDPEALSEEANKDFEEMIVFITDSTEDRCDEAAEDERHQEEEEYKKANLARASLILRRFRSIFQVLLKRIAVLRKKE
jgi:hypothetical protein